jgi:hypothetical protein
MDVNQTPGTGDFPEWPSDSWVDPLEQRALLRRRIWRFRLGFSVLGIALAVLSLSQIGNLILLFSGQRRAMGVQIGIPHWRLIEEAVITWGSLLGVCILWGRWPDVNWQRRSGILLMMCLVDAVLWTIDHATELGMVDGEIGHEWFRESLGAALGWSEFALIATLAADIAAHLGEPQALDLAKATRSLATTGAMVWFMFFYFMTSWEAPLWPLKPKGPNPGALMLALGWLVLLAINLVQVTGLSLLASRCCGRALREMAAADRASDLLPSRSEAGWDEMNRSSDPKNGT